MSKTIKVSAPARIDLCAGPTDWCGMNTLAMAINLRATAEATKLSDKNLVRIAIGSDSVTYTKPTYDGKLDLFKAVIELTGLTGFSIEYTTEIPKGSGLGGSAPLTVATVMALSKLFNKNWSSYYMAELAQRAETYKLHTVNGYQDQYAAMFGGLIFMNFEGKSCQRGDYSKTVEEEPYATVEDLTKFYPNFNIVVAVPKIVRAGSGQTNGSLSDRYLDGEERIVDLIHESAALAKEAKKCLVDGGVDRLYEIIRKDNDISRQYGFLTEENERMIEVARELGAVAWRTCGAGRGAVALFAYDLKTRDRIYETLKPTVEYIFKPTLDTGARYE